MSKSTLFYLKIHKNEIILIRFIFSYFVTCVRKNIFFFLTLFHLRIFSDVFFFGWWLEPSHES